MNDVVIVGASTSGMTAARACAAFGLTAIVLEKTAGARAVRLVARDGRVTGVVLEDREHARGPARGRARDRRLRIGPGADAALRGPSRIAERVGPGATGDGVRMGGSVGARVHLVRNNLNVMLGTMQDGAFVPLTDELQRPGATVVNRFGRRFADETNADELAAALRTFDAATARSRTCRVFSCSTGARSNCTRRSPAVPGLATDDDARVLNWRDHPIAGLYALGRLAVRDGDAARAERAAQHIATDSP